ncbi:MAG: AAA family ATPase, partial [archaeon]|nr:AAA family ATPase [archaeon]
KEEFLTSGKDMDIPFLRMGDIVRECYVSSGAEKEGLSVGQFAGNERKAHGADIWAKRAIERMYGDLFLVDGCRSMDEVRSFRSLGEDVEIVAIHASPSVRFDRLVKRQRDDAPADKGEFDARDARELSWGIGEVIALADHLVDNSSTIDEFRQRSAELLRSLR